MVFRRPLKRIATPMIEMSDISWSNGCFDFCRIALNEAAAFMAVQRFSVCEPANAGCPQGQGALAPRRKTGVTGRGRIGQYDRITHFPVNVGGSRDREAAYRFIFLYGEFLYLSRKINWQCDLRASQPSRGWRFFTASGHTSTRYCRRFGAPRCSHLSWTFSYRL